MIVENISVISKDDAFHALCETEKRNLIMKYIYAGFLVLIGVAVLCYGLFASDNAWFYMGIAVAALSVAYVIYNTVLIFNVPKKVKKNNESVCTYGVTYSYRFRETGCDLQVTCNGKKEKATYSYTDFKKVEEFSDRFVIGLANGVVLYVLKASFKDDKMMEFFKKNLGTNKKLKFKNKIK